MDLNPALTRQPPTVFRPCPGGPNQGIANRPQPTTPSGTEVNGQNQHGRENIIMKTWAEAADQPRVVAATTQVLDPALCTRPGKPRRFNQQRPQLPAQAAREAMQQLLRVMGDERGCMTELFETRIRLEAIRAGDSQRTISLNQSLQSALQQVIQEHPTLHWPLGRPHIMY
ncbi:MAG: hypothetical protein R3E95_12215 [Thiolinea sp.]